MSKGEVISATTATIIISAMVIIILGVLFSGFGGELKSQGTDKALACKVSVAKANLAGSLTDDEKYFSSCESIVWDVPDLGKDNEENKKRMATFIVKQYEQCWDKFHAGKLAPFAGDESLINTRCFVCSQFTMPQDAPRMTNMDEAIDWRFTIDEVAEAALEHAFYERDETRYYGVEKLNLTNWANKILKDLGSFGRQDFEELISDMDQWSVVLEPGQTYYIYNNFMVERQGVIFKNAQTHSKLMMGKPSFQPNICEYLHN